MNPMLGLINSTPATTPTIAGNSAINPDVLQAASQLKPVLQMLQSANNPNEMIQQMCMQNPGFKQAFETAKSIAGGDPKAAFYAAAKQQGVDPEMLINALKG